MRHTTPYLLPCALLLGLAAQRAAAQEQLLDRVQHTLSPQEERFHTTHADLSLLDARQLHANPAYSEWRHRADTTLARRSAIVYAGLAAADGEGDFAPYEGQGATDYRVGAYGEYATPASGTLAGSIQYAQGRHRHIGWSAVRLPEQYLPYVSTDSCGGTYRFDSYHAEGSYALTLGPWTLGAKGAFSGEQAYRLSDPRALNNTTWLRFSAAAARQAGRHLLMLEAGYARNKQHMQLRYWRPGQQDRFFVCYGFGLYDTRQSAVSFGKSRMYYIDEGNATLQYLSPAGYPLRLHAAMGYAHQHMQTEESDIYNLYELRSHLLQPLLSVSYDTRGPWSLQLTAAADIALRRGSENIIEEYLIDKDNNIYDFRTIDTRQNYSRNSSQLLLALKATRQAGAARLSLQGGITASDYEEKYASAGYRIHVGTLTPHARLSAEWTVGRERLEASMVYARQTVGSHEYDVVMQNRQIAHLDFQQAFAPYAFRAANLDKVAASVTWQHQFKDMAVGLSAKCALANGRRLDDAAYTGVVGFPSTAPMISPQPDDHQERWGSVTAFVTF